MAEIAICATDLAEVIGTAIGLNLLFGIPLEIGVFITALDVFLILYLQNLGFRWIEAFVVGDAAGDRRLLRRAGGAGGSRTGGRSSSASRRRSRSCATRRCCTSPWASSAPR